MVGNFEQMYKNLENISGVMEAHKKQSNARMLYEALSDAIVWSDELPAFEFDCMRFVFRYRTGILVGIPDPSYEPFWQEARRRFPKWIGFSDDRISFSSDALALYDQSRLKEFGPK